jgi:hypothetical protein
MIPDTSGYLQSLMYKFAWTAGRVARSPETLSQANQQRYKPDRSQISRGNHDSNKCEFIKYLQLGNIHFPNLRFHAPQNLELDHIFDGVTIFSRPLLPDRKKVSTALWKQALPRSARRLQTSAYKTLQW